MRAVGLPMKAPAQALDEGAAQQVGVGDFEAAVGGDGDQGDRPSPRGVVASGFGEGQVALVADEEFVAVAVVRVLLVRGALGQQPFAVGFLADAESAAFLPVQEPRG